MNNKLICVALHPPARLATRNSHTDVLTVDIYPFTADAQTHKITILMIFFFLLLLVCLLLFVVIQYIYSPYRIRM